MSGTRAISLRLQTDDVTRLESEAERHGIPVEGLIEMYVRARPSDSEANVLVVLVSGDPRKTLADAHVRRWIEADEGLHAPALLPYEFASGTRLAPCITDASSPPRSPGHRQNAVGAYDTLISHEEQLLMTIDHVRSSMRSGVGGLRWAWARSRDRRRQRLAFRHAYHNASTGIPGVHGVGFKDHGDYMEVRTYYSGDLAAMEDQLYGIEAIMMRSFPDVHPDWHLVRVEVRTTEGVEGSRTEAVAAR